MCVFLYFQVLMFSEKDTWTLFTLLAAVLHLGNLRFEGKTQEKNKLHKVINTCERLCEIFCIFLEINHHRL